MADFQKRSEDFLSWFQSQPGASFHSAIQLTDLRETGAGRGIIATSDIPADTELFSIPRKSVINVENSDLSKKLPKIFSTLTPEDDESKDDADDEDIEMPNPWLDLILVMIYEYLQAEASVWKPYFNVLPHDFDTLMFWTANELNELQASAVKDHVGKESADEMFQSKVLPIIKEHQDVFYPSGAAKLNDEELVKLAHRMGSIIMAYAFDLDEDDDDDEDDEEDGWAQDKDAMKSMGMVPMADMLNADAEFNAHLNHEEEKLTMTSLRPIKAGEEVLNYYGPLPSCDLLRRYGYTSPKHRRYDVVELPWNGIKSVIDAHFGREQKSVIDEEEIEESFVLERESGEPDDTGANTFPAEFVAFPEELEEQINHFIAPALKINIDKPDKAAKRRLRTTFAEIMAKAIPARLSQYPTTIEQDQEMLRGQEIAGRLRMAIEVRLGEKRLLQEAQLFANSLVEKYKEVAGDAEQSRTKRQKTSK